MNSNILLIEDNKPDVVIIQSYLEEASFKHTLYETDSFYDGMTILGDNKIDLVLLDLSLKDTFGFNTVKKYLQEAPDIPVIVLTGNKNEVVGMQSVRAGAQDFLIKGEFDSRQLVKTIRFSLQRFNNQAKFKKTAEQLSISKKRYQEAQEMAKFGNWEMDIVNNSMKWTDEMYRIFSFQPQSISPSLSDYLEYVHVEDRENVENFFEKVTKDGQMHRLEHRIVVDGVNIKYLAVQARINYDEYTNKILLIGGVQDISERRLSGQSVPLTAKPDKSTQLKEEAFSELSFNIRTPLSSIVNLIYLLEQTEISNSQIELMDGLKTSVDDLSIVLNNLLNFSLLVTDKVKVEEEQFNLPEFLEGIKRVGKIKSEQIGIPIVYHFDTDLPDLVTSDPQKIAQMLYNLLENALEYSNKDSKIDFYIRGRLMGRNDISIQAVVSYNGQRIPYTKLKPSMDTKQLLEMFTKDKKSKLSIAIVEKLASSMKGNFQVQNIIGKGSKLELEVPLKMQKPLSEIKLDKPLTPLKILLVEDHAINQIATTKVLTSWSDLVTVKVAGNGRKALDKIEDDEFGLILMDLQMPEMNGIEASINIRSKSDVPIIALTANASNQEQEKCLAIGMNDYIAKPFKPQELYTKILKLIGQPAKG